MRLIFLLPFLILECAFVQAQQNKFQLLKEEIENGIATGSKEINTVINLYIDWAKKEKDKVKEAEGYLYLGDYYYNQADLMASTAHYLMAVDQLKELSPKNDSLITHGYAYAAFNNSELQYWDKAYDILVKGLPYAKTISDQSYLADYYSMLGSAMFYLGDINRSTLYFDSCMVVERHLEDSLGLLKVLNNIGRINLESKRYDTAIKYYKEACSLIRGLEIDSLVVSKLYLNLADALAAENQLGEANNTLDLASSFANGSNNLAHKISLNLSKSTILQKQNFQEQSTQLLDQTLLLIPQDKYQIEKTNIVYELADHSYKKGDYQKANNLIEKAEKLATDQNLNNKLLNILDLQFKIKRSLGQFDQALTIVDRIKSVSQKIDEIEKEKTITSLNARYGYEKQLLEIAHLKDKEIIDTLEIEKLNNHRNWIATLMLLLLTLGIYIFQLTRRKYKESIHEKEALIKVQKKQIEDIQEKIKVHLEQKTSSDEIVSLIHINDLIKTPLSEREYEVLLEIYNGKTNQEIADHLYVSINTVKFHLKNIYEKLEVSNRVQALNALKY